uniref:Uncharacterized protein isoform X2 n=1 Tax=Nicotiana tabacum TaxID=4097 RepID=A0A1S4BFV8_TOBAC|nr:PREDICTED: uncharacterized protein LOC107807800 isoform X2 [Nicotiana tabacum]
MCCLSRMRCPRCMIYTSKIEANRAFWYRVGVGIIPTEPCRTFGLRVLRVLRVATAGFFLSSVPHCESATAAFFLSFTVTPSSSGSTMPRSPKARSPIWEHFELVEANEEVRKAKCLHCGRVYNCHPKYVGTMCLVKHIKKCLNPHPVIPYVRL